MIWLELIFVLICTAAFGVGWLVYRDPGQGGAAVLRTGGAGCAVPLISRPSAMASIETPCEAQSFLIVEIAYAAGPMTTRRREALERTLRENVGCCAGQVGRLIDRMTSLSRRNARSIGAPAFDRVARALKASQDKAELARLRSLMVEVAHACSGPTVDQLDMLARYDRIAGI